MWVSRANAFHFFTWSLRNDSTCKSLPFYNLPKVVGVNLIGILQFGLLSAGRDEPVCEEQLDVLG